MEQYFPIIFWTRIFWKIRSFDYSQHKILIMYTNARFQLIGRTALGPNLPKTIWMTKCFEITINIKIILSIYIVIHCCTKLQSIWRTSVCGTKLAQKYEWLKFWKNKYQNTTFQSIWRTFETKFVWTDMNDKKNEKINNEMEISI